MDGTLLAPGDRILPESEAALEHFRACGGKVGIASGRTYEQVRPFLVSISLDFPVVLFNGAVIADVDGRIRSVKRIDASVVKASVEAAQQLPSVWGILIQEVDRTVADRSDQRLMSMLEKGHVRVDMVVALAYSEFPDGSVKVMFMVGAGTGADVAKAVANVVGPRARVLVTSPLTVEVVATNANKADAIAEVLAEHSLALSDVLAFGDSGNDVEMLQMAGVGVAMGNCRPEACEAALLVAKDRHDKPVIAEIIEKLAILPKCRAGSAPAR